MISIRKASPNTKRANHHIPIYGGWLDVVVCDDLAVERAQYNPIFGPSNLKWSTTAHMSFSPDSGLFFVLFFKRDKLYHCSIAHEIHHFVVQLLDSRGFQIDSDHDEASAYLTDWATATVYKDLDKWKLRPR